jgi:acyl-CoA thioesterase YciA
MSPNRDPLIRTIAMPADANPAGDIFGGWLMAHMDLAAATLATRRARNRVVTAAVEAMSFLLPVVVGDEVSFYGTVLSVGRSSLKVRIEAWRRRREEEQEFKVTEATFTLVALGPDRRPAPIPSEDARVS